MRFHSIFISVLIAVALTGCESRLDLATQQMNDIRNKPPLPPEPIPTFSPVPTFPYSADRLRSPFIATSIVNQLSVMEGRRVYPNTKRTKQRLESYPLESLLMKGTMYSKTAGIEALIQTPDGYIETVSRGSYLGENHGRIVRITTNQIDLMEIVPDGRGNYIERPRTLILLQAVKPAASQPATAPSPETPSSTMIN